MISRRRFLQAASTSVAATSMLGMIPSLGSAMPYDAESRKAANALDDEQLKGLLRIAVDAAMSAGATYADARITVVHMRVVDPSTVRNDDEWRAIGVRVLADNCWGFMSSGRLTVDEASRLATGAVAQAQSNAVGEVIDVDLGTIPQVNNGVWKAPVLYDPFDIPIGEQRDLCMDLTNLLPSRHRRTFSSIMLHFRRERKLFFSSEGSAFDQTQYATSGDIGGQYTGEFSKKVEGSMHGLPVFPLAARGWEYYTNTDYPQHLEQYAEWLGGLRFRKPVEVDRCDAVFAPQVFARIIDGVVGAATELDRAMGYQANADGTSYLNEPLEILGTFRVGSDALTVQANRSMENGLATVRWDDEGVEPDTFNLVEKGMLADFQTTREQAAWLAPYYQATNKQIKSRGCATAETALFVTTQHTPNLQIQGGNAGVSVDDLIRETKRGVYVEAGQVLVDHQQLNGIINFPTMRLIRNGKLGDYVDGAGIPYRGPDMLKHLVALAGPETAVTTGLFRTRGQPLQTLMHSVSAVPAKILNVDIIDAGRAAGMGA